MNRKSATAPKDTLRKQAEEKLSKQKEKTQPFKKEDALRVVHELRVHQIELEMQNEELARLRAEAEATLSLYAELYAFAPVGYFTLLRDGTIRRVNITGAKLMGGRLSDLISRRLGLFVSPQSRATFSDFLDRVFMSENKETCEVVFQKTETDAFWAHVEAVCESSHGQPEMCYAIVSDITARKQAEEALRIAEANYRAMFENMPYGFTYCEMCVDDNDSPADFTYLAANNAFETLTGLKNVTGRKASEVTPGMRKSDPELLGIYELVSKTGKPERFEMFVKSLQMKFWISVYSPRRGCFAAMFERSEQS